MPRVLVDLLFHTGRRGGMESYVRELYSEMAAVAPDLEFVALASRELAARGASWFPGAVVDSGVAGESRAAWARAELLTVPTIARQAGADVIHSPANVGPWRARVPVVLTVHDLLPFAHPEWVPGPYSPVLRGLIRGAARNAASVLTISEASAADIRRFLPRASAKVRVAPLAGARGIHPVEAPASARPYLLAVGNRMPHKNFGAVLDALALIDPGVRPRVVMTGSSDDDPLVEVVGRLGLVDDVRLLSWVEESELRRLYSGASAVVVPSRFEGFGLPVLDAMAAGRPVIASDIPVLREVGGDAAVFVDTTDPAALARAIARVIGDADLRGHLSRVGLGRADTFSWRGTAEATAAEFRRVVAAR